MIRGYSEDSMPIPILENIYAYVNTPAQRGIYLPPLHLVNRNLITSPLLLLVHTQWAFSFSAKETRKINPQVPMGNSSSKINTLKLNPLKFSSSLS